MNSTDSTILQRIDAQEVIRLTQQLVAVTSVNPPGDETPIAELLGEFLSQAGFTLEYQEVYPRRANLVARLKGKLPGVRLLLCGHSDTMPAGSGWKHDPFSGEIEDGRLYGRGACDMKGGLAAIAAAGAALACERESLAGELIIAMVIDEENLGRGALRLVESGIQADWAVIGEPTQNVPVIASNGQINFDFTFHGKAGHGSTPESGHNAILDATEWSQVLLQLARDDLPSRSHPLTGAASLNIGTIHGGIQTSVIPELCKVTVDRRVVPGETTGAAIAEVEELLEAFRRANPTCSVEMEIPYCLPPVTVPEDEEIVRALRIANRQLFGKDPDVAGMRATTDAAILSGKGGIPTVVFGPGSIAQAHRADEYVWIEELVGAARIYAAAALELLS